MKWPQRVSIVDVCVGVVTVVVIAMPHRSAEAIPALDPPQALQVSRAEAATLAAPTDGRAVADLARALGTARELDWAVDSATTLAKVEAQSPSRWRALLAASVAHADRLDAAAALDFAQRALDACAGARAACPSWEEVRVQLYEAHLAAGVASGIDPKKDPTGFRRAAEAGMTTVRLSGGPAGPEPTATGSGSAGSAAP